LSKLDVIFANYDQGLDLIPEASRTLAIKKKEGADAHLAI